jgi:hypothetical protein
MVNLTPHPIRLRHADGTETVYPPDGTIARVVMREVPAGAIDGVPVIRRIPGEVVLGADPTAGCVIVSSMVLAALPAGTNAVAPDTGPTAIRDAEGQIIAVTRWVTI